MKYIIDDRIRNKYHKGFERKNLDVTHLIVHGTAGGNTAEANLKWMLDGGFIGNGVYRRDQYKRGVCLFQFIIDRNGDVVEIIDPFRWVYHSSTGQFDSKTIGVELTNPNRANGGFYTVEQYNSLLELIKILENSFPNMKYVQGHGSIKYEKSKTSKVCPGSGFIWSRFNQLMIEHSYKTILKGERIEFL